MNLKVYQAYYDNSQLPNLDTAFIPYDNTKNESPHLREYPMWKELLLRHGGSDAHWGLLSWRWHQKATIAGYTFTSWIDNTPGYDCYHFDPFTHLKNEYPNLWVQGDQWHSGMLEYANRLFPKLGINTPAQELKYRPENWTTCNYYIGNSDYWTSLLGFMDECLAISNQDEAMHKYLYIDGRVYNGHFIPNFSFVTERLSSLHNYLKPEFKVIGYV